MSDSGTAQSAAYNDQQTLAAANIRSSVASSKLEIRDRPGSRESIVPLDSASNAPHHRTASSETQKLNGYLRKASERRTERVQLSVRDAFGKAPRSPMKGDYGSGLDARELKVSERSGVRDRLVEKLPARQSKKEEGLRE